MTNTNTNILVVDDESTNVDFIVGALKAAGYGAAAATDGFKAIAACKVHMPDLILLDLQMPLMSGIDVFKRLRADEKTRDIPVVFMRRKGEKPSQLAEDDDEHWVVSKPVAADELLGRVKTALAEHSLKMELRKKDVELRELSLADPLTSFRSLRYLAEFLRCEINQCRRYGVPLSLVLLEIDDAQKIRQEKGQAEYNDLVSEIAFFVGQQYRQSDIVVRLSESELGLFLTHTDMDGAVEVAERIRESMAQAAFLAESRRVTVSIGVALWMIGMDEDGQMLISYARAAVNQAKAAGGNMTLTAQ
ncbi:MAG: diguanylate cyclase [Candidatus Obscuribacterales bacterium]|nr:diguanylate cyclase [Candidatus Obscuribacterales bacterium]